MSRVRAVLVAFLLSGAVAAPAARAEEPALVPSRIVVLSDHSQPVRYGTAITVRVRLESADGTPLAGRQLRIYEPSYIHVCCGPPPWRTTDTNGVVSMTSYPEGNSAHPQEYAAYWYGDTTYDKTITEWTQPMLGRVTTLTATHATTRTSGQPLPVTVDVRRESGSCIDDTVVEIELAGPEVVTATAVTDWAAGCAVTVDLPADLTPGTYAFTASTGHDGWSPLDEPVTIRRTVTVNWQHTFSDAAGRGVIRLNPETDEYLVTLAHGTTSGIQYAGPGGMARSGVFGTVTAWVLTLEHDDGAGTSAYGTFASAGTFDVSGTIDGVRYELSR